LSWGELLFCGERVEQEGGVRVEGTEAEEKGRAARARTRI